MGIEVVINIGNTFFKEAKLFLPPPVRSGMSLTGEEEFGEVEELDRSFWEPSSFAITPTKRKRL